MIFQIALNLIDADEIISKLLPTWPDLLAQLMATGILFLVIKKYVWEKIKVYLDHRAEYIERQIKDAEALKIEAQASLDSSKETYKKATIEYQNIIGKAKEDALIVKQEIVDQGEKVVQQRIEEAERHIMQDRQTMEDSMKTEIVDVALAATKKVLDHEMDQQANRNLIESFVEELKH